ncbi:unnamed protein product [Cunninghamella blakesleeana]
MESPKPVVRSTFHNSNSNELSSSSAGVLNSNNIIANNTDNINTSSITPTTTHFQSSSISTSWNPLTRTLFVRTQNYEKRNNTIHSVSNTPLLKATTATTTVNNISSNGITLPSLPLLSSPLTPSLSPSLLHFNTTAVPSATTLSRNENENDLNSTHPNENENNNHHHHHHHHLIKPFKEPLRMLPMPNIHNNNSNSNSNNIDDNINIQVSDDSNTVNRLNFTEKNPNINKHHYPYQSDMIEKGNHNVQIISPFTTSIKPHIPIEQLKENTLKINKHHPTIPLKRVFNSDCEPPFSSTSTSMKHCNVKIYEPFDVINSAKCNPPSSVNESYCTNHQQQQQQHHHHHSIYNPIESSLNNKEQIMNKNNLSPIQNPTYYFKRANLLTEINKNQQSPYHTNNNNNNINNSNDNDNNDSSNNNNNENDSNLLMTTIKELSELQQSNEIQIKEISSNLDKVMNKLDSFIQRYDNDKKEFRLIKEELTDKLNSNHLKLEDLLAMHQKQKKDISTSIQLYKSTFKNTYLQSSVNEQLVASSSKFIKYIRGEMNQFADVIRYLKQSYLKNSHFYFQKSSDDINDLKIQVKHILNDITSVIQCNQHVSTNIHYNIYHSTHELVNHLHNLTNGINKLEEQANEIQKESSMTKNNENADILVGRQQEKKVYGLRSTKITNNSNADEPLLKKRRKKISTKKDFETIGVESDDDAERQMQDLVAVVSQPLKKGEITKQQ